MGELCYAKPSRRLRGWIWETVPVYYQSDSILGGAGNEKGRMKRGLIQRRW